jgi:PmbA protein
MFVSLKRVMLQAAIISNWLSTRRASSAKASAAGPTPAAGGWPASEAMRRLADSAAARQLGIAPTGHAVRGASGAPGAGPSNLVMQAGQRSREEMIAGVANGILVTELIGQGVNGVTGDYSRGAAGFLIVDGEVGPAVSEITIASNLKDMFASLEPASDLRLRRGIDSPTLLVPNMMVASA